MIIRYIIYITILIVVSLIGSLSLHVYFKNMAEFRLLAHKLGANANVKAEITPVWSTPHKVNGIEYQSRFYAVSMRVN